MRAMQTFSHADFSRSGRLVAMRCVRSLAVVASIALALPVFAADVSVSGAWVRGTVAGQKTTGAFMQLSSRVDTTLVAVASPAAKIVQVHEMKMDGGMMKMRAVDKLAIPAGKPVELTPGGYHVMLVDLVAPLKNGDSVPLKLTFEDKTGAKQTVDVKAVVKPLTEGAPHAMK
jgi:copper(I)-binding protein